MLDILGGGTWTDGGASRRSFLRIGALGLGGLTLSDWLRLKGSAATTGPRRPDTAVIQVFLGGGPSHIDTYDPKPAAPREFRGEFRPIATRVPGIALSEMLPRHAQVMDKLAILRSLHHTLADHGPGTHWVMTGYPPRQASPQANERPSAGSIAARLRGANRPGVPPYVALPRAPVFGQAGYLGPGDNPFP